MTRFEFYTPDDLLYPSQVLAVVTRSNFGWLLHAHRYSDGRAASCIMFPITSRVYREGESNK
jgi:hypothetical protein